MFSQRERRPAVLHVVQSVEKWLLWGDRNLYIFFSKTLLLKLKNIFERRSNEYTWWCHSFGSLPVKTRQNQALTPVSGECITWHTVYFKEVEKVGKILFWRSSGQTSGKMKAILETSLNLRCNDRQNLLSQPIFIHASLLFLWVLGTLKTTKDWKRQVKGYSRALTILCTFYISCKCPGPFKLDVHRQKLLLYCHVQTLIPFT